MKQTMPQQNGTGKQLRMLGTLLKYCRLLLNGKEWMY